LAFDADPPKFPRPFPALNDCDAALAFDAIFEHGKYQV
jgi:hypothetical protein